MNPLVRLAGLPDLEWKWLQHFYSIYPKVGMRILLWAARKNAEAERMYGPAVKEENR